MNCLSQKTIAIEKVDGKVVKVLQIATLEKSEIAKLESEIAQENAKALAEKQEQELTEKNCENEKLAKLHRLAICVAYNLFTNLVEKGLCETTDEFENMFNDFLLGGSFNEEIAPIKFKSILERVEL